MKKVFSVLSLVICVGLCTALCSAAETPQTASDLTDQEWEDFLKAREPQKAAELRATYDEQGARLYLIQAIGKLKDKEALPLLLKGLNDRRPEVRLWSALALKDLGDKAAIEKLMDRLSDTAVVDCYGYCPSGTTPNVKLGVRRSVCVCDAAIEALNALIPGQAPEGRFEVFYPSKALRKTAAFQFFCANLPEMPDTGHWGDPARRDKAIKELREWWREK